MNIFFKTTFLFFLFYLSIFAEDDQRYNYQPYRDKYFLFLSYWRGSSSEVQTIDGYEVMFRVRSYLHLGMSLNFFSLANPRKEIFFGYDFANKSLKQNFLENSYSPYMSSFKIRYFPFNFGFFIGTSLKNSSQFKQSISERYIQNFSEWFIIQTTDSFFLYEKNYGILSGISFDSGLFNIFPQKWWNSFRFGIIFFIEVSYQIFKNTKNQTSFNDFYLLRFLAPDYNFNQIQFLNDPDLLYYKINEVKKQKLNFQKEFFYLSLGWGFAY